MVYLLGCFSPVERYLIEDGMTVLSPLRFSYRWFKVAELPMICADLVPGVPILLRRSELAAGLRKELKRQKLKNKVTVLSSFGSQLQQVWDFSHQDNPSKVMPPAFQSIDYEQKMCGGHEAPMDLALIWCHDLVRLCSSYLGGNSFIPETGPGFADTNMFSSLAWELGTQASLRGDKELARSAIHLEISGMQILCVVAPVQISDIVHFLDPKLHHAVLFISHSHYGVFDDDGNIDVSAHFCTVGSDPTLFKQVSTALAPLNTDSRLDSHMPHLAMNWKKLRDLFAEAKPSSPGNQALAVLRSKTDIDWQPSALHKVALDQHHGMGGVWIEDLDDEMTLLFTHADNPLQNHRFMETASKLYFSMRAGQIPTRRLVGCSIIWLAALNRWLFIPIPGCSFQSIEGIDHPNNIDWLEKWCLRHDIEVEYKPILGFGSSLDCHMLLTDFPRMKMRGVRSRGLAHVRQQIRTQYVDPDDDEENAGFFY